MKTPNEILRNSAKRRIVDRAKAEVVSKPKAEAKRVLDPEGWRRSRKRVLIRVSQEMLKRMGAKPIQRSDGIVYYGPVRHQRWNKWAGVWG